MKNILLLFLLIPIVCSAQSFVVTPDGLKDRENLKNSFVVVTKENTSAEELYNTSIKYVNEQMKNPGSSIKSDIKGDYIRYSVYIPEIILYSNSGSKRKIQGFFDVEFRFKDNRVRYEIVSISMPDKDSKYEVVFSGSKWSGYPIYEKNGKLFKEKEKEELELFFNALLSTYVSYLNEGSTKDDW